MHPDSRLDYLKAVTLVVLACFLLAAMDGIGKHLMQTQQLHQVQVVWARYLFHTLLVALVFGLQHKHHFIKTTRLWLQLIRGLCLLGVTFAMYTAIREIPLADATAIMFLAPVLVTLFAAWLLNEAVRPMHWLALGLGFAGVISIIQPGFSEIETAMLYPLASALLLSLYFVFTRQLKGHDSEATTLFHTTAVGSVFMCLVVPFYWTSIDTLTWLALILIGALGATGHLLLIKAFHLSSASSMSPVLNAQILAAALYSVVWFDDPLSPAFAMGSLLIVLAGLITWREEKRITTK